jgi:histone deacetylase complex regulatory component SIN3
MASEPLSQPPLALGHDPNPLNVATTTSQPLEVLPLAMKAPPTELVNPRIEALVQDGQRPRSRAKTRTPRPATPKEDAAAAGADDPTRPLNVTDALGYLDEVKRQFADKPDVYNYFVRMFGASGCEYALNSIICLA